MLKHFPEYVAIDYLTEQKQALSLEYKTTKLITASVILIADIITYTKTLRVVKNPIHNVRNIIEVL